MPETKGAPETAISEAQTQEDQHGERRKTWAELFAQSPEAYRYSVKAWHTQPKAKTHGKDPLAAYEPAYFGRDMRIAARMCDIQRNRYAIAPHIPLDDLLARAVAGTAESPQERAHKRATARASARLDFASFAVAVGAYPAPDGQFTTEGVLAVARLTPEEWKVFDLVLDGRDQSQIAMALDKALGTVKVLRKRAVDKVRALAEREAAA